MSFVMGFQNGFALAYQAIEFIGITTSETANPRQVLPKAIKEIPLRIVLFYGGSTFGNYGDHPVERFSNNRLSFVLCI